MATVVVAVVHAGPFRKPSAPLMVDDSAVAAAAAAAAATRTERRITMRHLGGCADLLFFMLPLLVCSTAGKTEQRTEVE